MITRWVTHCGIGFYFHVHDPKQPLVVVNHISEYFIYYPTFYHSHLAPAMHMFLFVGIEVELHAWNFINSLCCNCNECLELCHHLHLHLFHEILIIELLFHSNDLLQQTRLNLWLFSWLALSETSISSPRHPIVILPNVISSPTTFAFWFVDFRFMDVVNYRFVINRLTCWVVWLKCTCFGKLLKFNIDWHEEILVVPMSILSCWHLVHFDTFKNKWK